MSQENYLDFLRQTAQEVLDTNFAQPNGRQSFGGWWIDFRATLVSAYENGKVKEDSFEEFFERWQSSPPATEYGMRVKLEKLIRYCKNPENPAGVALSQEEQTIMEALKEESPMTLTQEDLANKTRLSDRTVRKCLRRLRENLGLTHRPLGVKKGETLTNKGIDLLRR